MKYIDLTLTQSNERRTDFLQSLESTDCNQRDVCQSAAEAIAMRAMDLTGSMAEVEKLAAQMVIFARILQKGA